MGVGVRHSSLKKNKDGETDTTIISDKGLQISPLITENRIVNKDKVIINGEEFENGIDVGIKNNNLNADDVPAILINDGEVKSTSAKLT